jgi:hypothetical protein
MGCGPVKGCAPGEWKMTEAGKMGEYRTFMPVGKGGGGGKGGEGLLMGTVWCS